MTMSLIPCIECGSEISSNAKKCPKCETVFPNGSPCPICNLREKASAYPNGVVHPECIEKVEREGKALGLCSACNKNVRFVPEVAIFPSVWANNYACPICGHPKKIPTRQCAFCHRRVIVSQSAKVHVRGFDNFAHNACSHRSEEHTSE